MATAEGGGMTGAATAKQAACVSVSGVADEKYEVDGLHEALDAALLALGTDVPKPVSRITADYCRGSVPDDATPMHRLVPTLTEWVALWTAIMAVLVLLVTWMQVIDGRRRGGGGRRS